MSERRPKYGYGEKGRSPRRETGNAARKEVFRVTAFLREVRERQTGERMRDAETRPTAVPPSKQRTRLFQRPFKGSRRSSSSPDLNQHSYACAYKNAPACMYIHVNSHVYTCVYACAHAYICMYIYICVYVLIHIFF
ncbi:hypothetical protein TGARI_301355 [Toxoplasma gondii ARI]|uniref:Transmembrane protein n=1 Tax=Toxoplasma gondii ARI TaxID=1074872 RepID=A0A139XJI7_TOXGO|nr:hypothetical protein TGARI_301355 [Toxoplasma gondii ARI]